MKGLIKEAKRMQQIAGIAKEDKLQDQVWKIQSKFNYAIDDAWKALTKLGYEPKATVQLLKEEFMEAMKDLVRNGVMSENETMSGGVDPLEAKVRELYASEGATEEQIAKLVKIYRNQMENEGTDDVEDFFLGLEDSSDPNAFIELSDLPKYKRY